MVVVGASNHKPARGQARYYACVPGRLHGKAVHEEHKRLSAVAGRGAACVCLREREVEGDGHAGAVLALVQQRLVHSSDSARCSILFRHLQPSYTQQTAWLDKPASHEEGSRQQAVTATHNARRAEVDFTPVALRRARLVLRHTMLAARGVKGNIASSEPLTWCHTAACLLWAACLWHSVIVVVLKYQRA